MVSFLTEEQHNKSDVQGKLFRGWKVGCNGGGETVGTQAKLLFWNSYNIQLAVIVKLLICVQSPGNFAVRWISIQCR